MAYLMLYGTGGWSQRWQIAPGEEDRVQAELSRVGKDGTGRLPVVDPRSEKSALLVVSWAAVATAVVVDAETSTAPEEATGQYA